MFDFLSRRGRKGFPKKDYVIIHGAHHKAGTNWIGRILRKIAVEFGWNFEIGTRNKNYPEPETNIFHHWHSNIDFSTLNGYLGSHMVRDPRDMVVSGYFYHLWCDEKWCKRPIDEFDGKCYRDVLQELPQEEGMQFEMSSKYGTFQNVVKNMTAWNYDDPRIKELRFEDLVNNAGLFEDLFDFYGFNNKEKEIAMKIVRESTFEKLSKRKAGIEDRKHHYRKGIPGDWRNYFTPCHKTWFKQYHQDLLEMLGYEKNTDW